MKHAFMMLVHKDFEQVNTLVSNLSFGDIYIHVDKKNNQLFDRLATCYKDAKNVFLLKDRINVNWSGFSMVEATLSIIKYMISNNRQYDYVHLISGQDMVLMTNKQLDNFLSSIGKNKILMEYADVNSYRWRVKRYSFFRENPNNRKFVYRVIDNILRYSQFILPERKNLNNLKLYKGSQWFTMPYECLEYVHILSKKYISDFQYTACSDEHFFQILIMNSKYKDNVINNNARYIVFKKNKASPEFISLNDFDKMMNGQYIFARKFESSINKNIVEKIQNVLLNN